MFSVDFLLIDSNNSYKFFNKMFYSKFIIYNQLVKHCINLLQKLKFDSYYQSLLTEYKCADDKSKKAIAKDLNDSYNKIQDKVDLINAYKKLNK